MPTTMRLPLILLLLAAAAAPWAVAADPGQVTVGDARFTVVTPNCIRLEYAPGGRFVDDASLFAVNRAARGQCTISREGPATVIRTAAVHLTYTPDGEPFSAGNLSARIRRGDRAVTWHPGMPSSGNLGGTDRTLDGWNGANRLPDGVLSRDGWYLLDDSRRPLLTADWVRSRPAEAGLDWYLFAYGDDYRAALRALTTIGGPVPLPRKVAFGVWFSRYWPFSSEDYRGIVGEYASHGYPLDIMVMDMDWHKDGWTGWSWNRNLLPDAEGLLKWFHQQGIAVTMNLHPADGIGPHEDMYADFMRDMGQDPASGVTLPFDAGDKRYLDTLFKYAIDPHEREGVDFWWLDWQQYAFTRSIPDLTNLQWLNHYFYQHTSQDGERGMSFSRWAGWGDHRNPIHFSGDANTGWRMLTAEVPFTSTAGNMGCFFWSHDTGGHMGGRNEESYARWCQFGATTAALRSHSTRDPNMDRRPWLYPDWAEASMRISFNLRSRLMPYIYSSAWESCRDSVPLNRPLYIDYPGLEPAYHNPQEYLFGDNLLVAPITMPGVGPDRVGWQSVWFPPGVWYDYFTGERYQGPCDALVAADLNEFPLFVRAGTPLPTQPFVQRPGTAQSSVLRVRCYPGAEGVPGSFTLYEDDGATTAHEQGERATTELSCLRQGNTTTVRVAPTRGQFAGQLARRTLALELPGTAHATRVTVDGKPASAGYDAATFSNLVRVLDVPVGRGCTIVVKAKLAGAAEVRLRAASRRAGLPRPPLPGATLRSQLLAALDAAPDAPRQQAALAAFGIGLLSKNETAYGWPEGGTPYLYAPPDLLDSNEVTWAIEAPSTGEVLPGAVRGMLNAVTPVPELMPPVSARQLQVRAEISVGGRTIPLRGLLSLRPDFTRSAEDVARQARVTVSSLQPGTNERGANDGIVDGYPTDHRFEWSSGGQTSGAWIRLDWDTPQTVDRVWLYDRINQVDQVTSGTLTLSDGSTYPVGALNNDAAEAAEVSFPPRAITWLKFTIEASRPDTQNTGLAEVVVMQAP
jgi:hypothetical protein